MPTGGMVGVSSQRVTGTPESLITAAGHVSPKQGRDTGYPTV